MKIPPPSPDYIAAQIKATVWPHLSLMERACLLTWLLREKPALHSALLTAGDLEACLQPKDQPNPGHAEH